MTLQYASLSDCWAAHTGASRRLSHWISSGSTSCRPQSAVLDYRLPAAQSSRSDRASLQDSRPAGLVRWHQDPMGVAEKPPVAREALVATAEMLLKVRRLRTKRFPEDLFADPAWDIFLDLFVSHMRGRRHSVSSVCIAAGVPSTTGLRWIGRLTEDGWLKRSIDTNDRRRSYVTLAPRTLEAVKLCLEDMSHEVIGRQTRSRSQAAYPLQLAMDV
ncbi:winged helix DNA-binding protein [Sandaracinobacteroides saxicola]|uniref:winged helix DNA-binding protein n=1 Tax=Sandaracinobacteroides saxicola TaxID=2759707 RepID=UPI0037DA0E1B